MGGGAAVVFAFKACCGARGDVVDSEFFVECHALVFGEVGDGGVVGFDAPFDGGAVAFFGGGPFCEVFFILHDVFDFFGGAGGQGVIVIGAIELEGAFDLIADVDGGGDDDIVF